MTSLPAATAAYTPLESFLLFNYLKQQGADHSAFRKISTLLQENPNIKSDPKFDSGRLSADALSDFYLRLLKEEARSELERQNGAQDDLKNGDAQGSSKKRKAASPSSPTVEEASKNTHLIPQLISKLYARFCSKQVREIREQERRYDELQREVREIEQGQWNDRLQREVQKGQWDAILGQAGIGNSQRNGVSPAAERAAPSNAVPSAQPQATAGSVPDIKINHAPSPQPGAVSQAAPGSARASPAPRATERKSPVPKTSSMPPPSTTQRLAPQPSPSPPVHAPQHRGPTAQQPYVAGSPQPPGPQQHAPPPNVGPTGAPYAQYPKSAPAYGSPAAGSPMPPYPQQPPPPPNTYPRPPHQQPGYRPSRVGGIELPPFQLNSSPASTPSRPPTQPPPAPPGFSPHPLPGQNAQPFIRQADGRMVPLPPTSMLDSIMGALSRDRGHASSRRTKWKQAANASVDEVPRPERESLSPPLPSAPAAKSLRGRKQRPTPSAELDTEVRRGPGRPRRIRGGSAASSAVPSSKRSRTRSQSVTSHMSVDNESIAGRRVKHEPGTPLDDDVSATIEDSPHGTLRRGHRANAQQAQVSRKRRRSVHDTSEPSEFSQEPLPRPSAPATHVLVSKNFARTCQPVLNDILSHKHASLFSNAVKERDAPGYYEHVLRPQDFKAIRKAISDGSRTVAAALADALPAGESPAPGATSGYVMLPISVDLVPPKAIVNSSQFEKEITRVFANAAMFNIGDDPVVQDAREMFDSVQKSLADWRSVERTAEMGNVPVLQRQATREVEDSEVDELAGDGGGSVAAGKRRKIG